MSVAHTQHYQSQSIAILAIATGAIGFGLFQAEFRVSMEFLPTVQVDLAAPTGYPAPIEGD